MILSIYSCPRQGIPIVAGESRNRSRSISDEPLLCMKKNCSENNVFT
jgi:hypothetical protein